MLSSVYSLIHVCIFIISVRFCAVQIACNVDTGVRKYLVIGKFVICGSDYNINNLYASMCQREASILARTARNDWSISVHVWYSFLYCYQLDFFIDDKIHARYTLFSFIFQRDNRYESNPGVAAGWYVHFVILGGAYHSRVALFRNERFFSVKSRYNVPPLEWTLWYGKTIVNSFCRYSLQIYFLTAK